MVQNFSNIKAPYGRFYAGMTLKEAQLNGTDKSFWRRDFHNLDKNKDGVLSVNEIMKERKRESNIEKITALIFGAFGIHDLMTFNKTPGVWKYLWLGLDALVTADSAMKAYKIDKKNQQIKQQLEQTRNNNTTFIVNV